MKISRIKKCRFCKSKELEKVINLGPQFLQGYFQNNKLKKTNQIFQKKFLTELVRCNPEKDKNACGLLQMSTSVPTKILYEKYFYRSGINSTMVNHLNQIADDINKIYKKKKKIKILDIGCNDGTLLKFFSNKFDKYGIDPSDSFPKSGIKNINYIKDFFPSSKLKKVTKNKKFDIITSIAMFYDLENPASFVENIYENLDKEGIFVFEVSYMPEMLKLNSFDTICHEHLEYYSLSVIQKIFSYNDMKIAKVEFNKSNGGSIRCFAVKKQNNKFGTNKDLNLIKKMLKKESSQGLKTKRPYLNFKKKILVLKNKLKKIILKLKKEGKTIHVYGASTKGNTILQYCKINNKLIKYAADRNPEKIGLKTLGSNITIISEEDSRRIKPDYYLVLPWHFQKEFIKRERLFLKNGGKFIFPLPQARIIK